MKIKNLLLLAVVCCCLPCMGQKQLLVGGSGWDRIMILDKQTQRPLWTHPVEGECNSVACTKKGDVLYSHSNGAKLVTRDHRVIWSYAVERGEVQTASLLPDGGFLLAVADSPARIIELDAKGKVVKEVMFDTKIAGTHGQFRKVGKTKKGTYLIPLMARREVVEINDKGEVLKNFKAEGNIFAVCELKDGNLLISCGDAHSYIIVDRTSGETVKKVKQNDLDGVALQFVAEIVPVKDHLFICNWSGHSDAKAEPSLVEVNAAGKVVWALNDRETYGDISAVFPIR